ncbi:NAD(P)/FAD-dependent oxidoreductase [Halobacillus litoralis]|uniref:NAD(P)/FAD-dependent oxidoreductase n=1 Tax=Halobacillus litoralis TaxID=45668 RepID=UPI00136E8629|nr:FAD-dependent oxidoreductase [Halobacillus litoralis]MYL37919.1 FAD-dependent oxidoreductase [Halobacillus litoralis]
MKYLIVGAGILGASTAYHLAEKGEKVAIVDRGEQGQATRNAAGIICPWLTNRTSRDWYQLAVNGAGYYPELVEKLKEAGISDPGYKRVGALNIFDTEEKLDQKAAYAEMRKLETPEMGEISKLSPKETRDMFPPLAEHYRSLHLSGAGRVNGSRVTDSLLKAAERKGAEIIRGNASLRTYKGEIEGVDIDGVPRHADQIILTNGSWMRALFGTAALSPRVTFEKAQIIHLHLTGHETEHWPVLLPPFSHYMLGFEGGKLVVGATKEKIQTHDSRVTAGGIHQLLEKALRTAPGLNEATYVETKVGFRPFTPGSLPVFGRLPDQPHIIAANGLGASGLTSGPYVGSLLSALAAGEDTSIDISPYTIDRLFK